MEMSGNFINLELSQKKIFFLNEKIGELLFLLFINHSNLGKKPQNHAKI